MMKFRRRSQRPNLRRPFCVAAACTAILLIGSAESPRAQYQRKTAPVSTNDRIWLEVDQIDSLHSEVLVMLENSESLAAITLPFRWGRGKSPFQIDSADYAGLRTQYFALKTFLADSADQTILIGLISDLGMNLPPLEPGNGPIARLHFTARHVPKKPLALDTTFISPHNVLQLVTPDVRAVRPRFETASAEPKSNAPH